MAELLFELGSEELPARFVVTALNDLEKLFREQCTAARISHGTIHRFATPRRLALLIDCVAEKTDDVVKEVLGPSLKAAFEVDGTPKVPATKFAASVDQPMDKLKRVSTPKGDYLAADVQEKGRHVIELLPEVLGMCVKKLSFPKSMRWGDLEQSFARPLQWIVALFGPEVVPVVFADVTSGRQTRGHRFLAPHNITLEKPSDYEVALEKAHVVPSLEKRRELLVKRLDLAAKQANGILLQDAELLEEVLNLVELPNPLVGTFGWRYLDLPPEVLIQEMKCHQRYFSLTDASGKSLPRFIAVSNTPVRDEALSVKGYERVLRARLEDGRFFFEEDCKSLLQDRLPKLARRNWIQDLGSMAEKTDRIRALALFLARMAGKDEHRMTIERAAQLSKCDLETGMVGEFPELQGVMGREYALREGESEEVALAIFEHYLPRGATDSLPTQDPGAFIGLADRIDSLCGLFAVGKKPSGAKDDYALRRAAIAIINIIIGRVYRFSLSTAVDESLKLLVPALANVKKAGERPVKQQVLEFIQDRLRSLWGAQHRSDIIDAVVAAGADDLVAARLRVDALSAYVSRADFAALGATFKRVANIIEKQAMDVSPGPVDVALFQDPAETALHAEAAKVINALRIAVNKDDYLGSLVNLVPLKPFVDMFFDHVMVMAADQAVRQNRVRLLLEISGLFSTVADLSKIQSED